MKIKLGNKMVWATVDDDFVIDKKHCFSLTKHGYARANIYLGKKDGKYKYRYIYLHQIVMGKPPKGLVIDHINRDKLDNRKSNLRFCRHMGNAQNKTSSSGYKGVHYQKKNAKYPNCRVWAAQITKNYKTYHLGSFKTPEEAAKAYNQAATELHGEYAVLNTVD